MLNKLISLIVILSVLCQVTLCNPMPDDGLGDMVIGKLTEQLLESEEFDQLLTSCKELILNSTKDAFTYLKEHKGEMLEKAKQIGTVFAKNLKIVFDKSLDKMSKKLKTWKEKTLITFKNAAKNTMIFGKETKKKVEDGAKELRNKLIGSSKSQKKKKT